MTGQDGGGFRAAAARFKSEVEAALTRARRAADEAKAQSAEFRRGNEDLAKQAKTGRLRRVHRGEVAPTSAEARAEAERFRTANDLTVEDLPDAGKLMARLPDAPAEEPVPRREDEDFSQHTVLFDLDGPDAPETPGLPDRPAGRTSPASTRWTRPPTSPRTPGSIHGTSRAPGRGTRTRTFRNSESSSTRPSNPTVRIPCRIPCSSLRDEQNPS